MRLELQHTYKIYHRKKQVYDLFDANITFSGNDSIAVLAQEERSSTSFLRLIAGIDAPTRGKIIRDGAFSIPIGEDSYFHRELSAEENIRFIAKIYGQNQQTLLEKVKNFTNLSKELKEKTKKCPSTLKRKIALATSLLIEADYYQLYSPIKEQPQPKFQKKVQNRLKRIAKQACLFAVSENQQFLKQHTQSAVVIDSQGRITFYEDLDEGIAKHKQLKQDNTTNAVE